MIIVKGKKLDRYCHDRFKFHSALRVRFYFLAFCLLLLVNTSQVLSEQLDPTHLIVAHFVETSQESNDLNVTAEPFKNISTSSRAKATLQDMNISGDFLQLNWPSPYRQILPQISFNFLEANAVSFTDQFDKETPQGLSTDEPISNNNFEIQLWKTRVGVPEKEKDRRSSAELRRIIEQIHTMKFEDIKQAAESVIADGPIEDAHTADVTEPNEILFDANRPSDTNATEGVADKQVALNDKHALRNGPLAEQNLQIIRSLSQQPEGVSNALKLAEVLFRGGYLKEASVFYQEALNRGNQQEPFSVQEKAWILFQIGNCFRDEDLTKALKMYRQVILECPDTPWTDLAKIQEKLISLYQKEEPRKLVKIHSKIKSF